MKKVGAHKRIRRTPEEIREAILEVLIEGPKTIDEIVIETKSHFPVTKDFIGKLTIEGEIIESRSEKNQKIYLRKDYPVFYRIPISKIQRDKTLAILRAIVEEYRIQHGEESKFPFKTVIQKIAVDYIEENDPSLPVMNFKFGKICCLAYDENIHSIYNFTNNLSREEMEKIKESVNKFIGKNATQAKIFQYKQKGMRFYELKEEILDLFFNAKEKSEELSKNLIEWSIHYPDELESTYHLFDTFIYCATNILRLKKLDDEKIKQLKELFDGLWNILSIDYFFESASRFIQPEKKSLFEEIQKETILQELFNMEMVLGDLKTEVDMIPSKDFKEIDMDNKTAKLLHLLLED